MQKLADRLLRAPDGCSQVGLPTGATDRALNEGIAFHAADDNPNLGTRQLSPKGNPGFATPAYYPAMADLDSKEIGARVKTRREALKLSQEALARDAGISQSTIDRIESGDFKRLPSGLYKVARVLSLPLGDLTPDNFSRVSVLAGGELYAAGPELDVFGTVEAGGSEIVRSSEPVDRIARPAPLAQVRGAYAVIVSGESMVPAIRPGDYVLVNPHLPPRIEDACLFSGERHGEFRATIKEYRGQTSGEWRVRRYRPKEQDFTLKKADFPKCEVVIGKYSRR